MTAMDLRLMIWGYLLVPMPMAIVCGVATKMILIGNSTETTAVALAVAVAAAVVMHYAFRNLKEKIIWTFLRGDESKVLFATVLDPEDVRLGKQKPTEPSRTKLN